MPSADPPAVIEIRFSSPIEKKHYQSLVSEKSSIGFAKYVPELVRNHFKGESDDSPLVIDLKQQVENLASEFLRVETENLYLRRVMESKDLELVEVRERMYSSPEVYTAELFTMMYAWFLKHKETTKPELMSHIADSIKVPNLVEAMKEVEMTLITNGIIEVKDGIIYCLVEE